MENSKSAIIGNSPSMADYVDVAATTAQQYEDDEAEQRAHEANMRRHAANSRNHVYVVVLFPPTFS
jgi:hypothetical protein